MDGTQRVTIPFFLCIFYFYQQNVAGKIRKVASNITSQQCFLTTLMVLLDEEFTKLTSTCMGEEGARPSLAARGGALGVGSTGGAG